MTERPQPPPLATEEHDDLPIILRKAFAFKPGFSIQSPEAEQHPYHGTLPFDFYDRHLDANLALKRVVVSPLVPKYLADKVDSTLADLKHRKIGPLPLRPSTIGQFNAPVYEELLDGIISPQDLAIRYLHSYGNVIPALASSWIVHPLATQYFSTLRFDGRRSETPGSGVDMVHEYTLRFKPFDQQRQQVISSIDDQTKAALRDLAGKHVFTCLFLPMCAETEELFRGMDDLIGTIPSPAYTTTGSPSVTTPVNPPCDAKKTSWTIPPPVNEPEQRKEASRQRSQDIRPSLRQEGTSEFEEMKTLTPAGLLHHVWHRSVAENTTLILISCGNYERIGIRHRASQTLLLSELLDISRFDKPSYGQVHFGLFLSAISDALDRHEQTYIRPPPAKRSTPDTESRDLRRSKRIKVQRGMSKIQSEISPKKSSQSVWKALPSRPLGLVSVKFGPLNSPVVTACLRTGGTLSGTRVGANTKTWKKCYKIRECFSLILDSDLSFGATGRLHSAHLEVENVDGKSSIEVVVKAAIDPSLRKRLRKEYAIYRHLWKHQVSSIPAVYGLLEDSDDMVTFLVLQKLRMSFRDREPFDTAGGLLLCVTHEERSLCLAALRKIHEAGVLHRDLRAENILIADDGTPMIIDFDRAQFNPEPEQTKYEMGRFQEVLDGKVVGKVIFFSTSSDN
ncbi:hypothetical protein BDN72DRAFT_842608 [Pluteus cervinus]|uniref:Uncharacterized protein n=1 Tax=Pluteus cervinus TaxID=181527 RepID=A0ACD3AR53_9AGAR|nr:hypothetical protein BDN72DRAFT_842608 [Pluteus cervinus]